jgi:hypothetical protein
MVGVRPPTSPRGRSTMISTIARRRRQHPPILESRNSSNPPIITIAATRRRSGCRAAEHDDRQDDRALDEGEALGLMKPWRVAKKAPRSRRTWRPARRP